MRSNISDITFPSRTFDQSIIMPSDYIFNFDTNLESESINNKLIKFSLPLSKYAGAYFGIQTNDRSSYVSIRPKSKYWKPAIDGTNHTPERAQRL